MPSYDGMVAVITGGASGIGLAIAASAGAHGMTVVLIDVDEAALGEAAATLQSDGVAVHTIAADVADREAMMAAGERVSAEIGDTWLLVNNAGVFLAGPFLEMTPQQRDFILSVNLWGVIYGLDAFLPGMVARDSGYVVNTSSVDGIVTVPNAASYNAAKHAVTALTETLFRELDIAGSKVGVSVLCPGAVATNIVQSARHWPVRLGPAPQVAATEYPELDEVMAPAQVADIMFEGIAARRFWILTHPQQYAAAMRARTEGIINGANPDDTTVDPNFRSDRGRVPQ
jgi:NADP-dependent 3-hydroxy acid dehydrogenase YdfG